MSIPNPRYCPTDWLEERSPLGGTPEAFARHDSDKWILMDPDKEIGAEVFFKNDLEAGQVVNFARLTTYDDFHLTIREDGSHYADMPEFDGDPYFRLDGWEDGDWVDELSELIRLGASGDIFSDVTNPLQAGTYLIECCAWRDTIPFRFEPDGNTPKFVLCAGTN